MRQRVSWYMLPLLLLLCSGLLAATVIPSRAITPHQQIADSWQAMRRAQSYGFSLDVVQKTIPLATVANLGARSSEQTAHHADDPLEPGRLTGGWHERRPDQGDR